MSQPATGLGMKAQIEIASLRRRYQLAVPAPVIVPLVAPIDGAVIVSGLAATRDIDLALTRFRAFAFCNPCFQLKDYSLPKLLWKHDQAQVAGKILELRYDDRGQVRIVCEVDHEIARRAGAFSVAAKILAFEVQHGAQPHVLVTNAEITEISLTDIPCNPQCLVQSRYPAPPIASYLATLGDSTALLINSFQCLQKMLGVLQDVASAPPPRVSPQPRVRPQSQPRPPARASQFRNLVEAMNNGVNL